jgi:transcription antitermination factor NusA-like protein
MGNCLNKFEPKDILVIESAENLMAVISDILSNQKVIGVDIENSDLSYTG